MTTAAKAPRKAARARVKKAASGQRLNGQQPANGAAQQYQPPTTVDRPQEVKPPEVEEHPVYGTKRVYAYQPRNGDLIEFPHISTVVVTPKFFWKIYALNEMFQSFEWMNQADVPRDIQERVLDLPDSEKAIFFKGWFQDITQPQGVAPPGES